MAAFSTSSNSSGSDNNKLSDNGSLMLKRASNSARCCGLMVLMRLTAQVLSHLGVVREIGESLALALTMNVVY